MWSHEYFEQVNTRTHEYMRVYFTCRGSVDCDKWSMIEWTDTHDRAFACSFFSSEYVQLVKFRAESQKDMREAENRNR